MDLHRTGSDELINIQTDKIELTIKGPSTHPRFAGAHHMDGESELTVYCEQNYDIGLPANAEMVCLHHLKNSYSGEYRMEPLFFEQQRYELIIEPTEGHEASFWHENYNIRRKVTPVGRRRSILSGVINFGNDIGYSDLIVRVDGIDHLKLTIEVFPSKISYKDDYKAIVADVTAEVYNLAFDILKKTYDAFDINSSQQSSQVEFFAIIRKIYSEFISSADIILHNPHHQLKTDHEVVPWHKVKRTDDKTIKWLEKHPEQTIRSGRSIKAEKALAVRKYVTFDTKENRLTKYMLQQTAKRLELFKKQYCRLKRQTDEEIIKVIDTMVRGIQRRCSTGFMKEVNARAADSGMSLVFGMAPGYRDLYRYYMLLQRGLSITGSVFNLSVKDLAVLYEYWCFIKLNSMMKEKYQLVSQDIIRIRGAGLYISLEKGHRSKLVYLNPSNGEKITLSYNPKEINVPTVTQRPDNVLRLEKKGAHIDYEYVFDAKYRINPSLPGTDYNINIDEHPGPEVEDINTMHRYRDAIVYQNGASPFERTMFGAYVFFPYHDEELYEKHRFFKSIDQVNIGGLPFLPSTTELVTNMLDQLISDSPDSAFERATLPRGIEEKLAKVDWSRRDVLISTLSSKAQVDICLQHRLFIAPASYIKEEDLPIRYVAIYQSKAKFGSDARIEHYGEVKSVTLVKRNEIAELPSESDESYYRFDIVEWKKLDRPVEPKEIGFPVRFTNMFLLKHSTTVPELFLRSEEEYRFYSELKRRTDAAVINEGDSSTGFEIGETKVAFEDGKILVLNDGKIINSDTTVSEFAKRPNSVFRRIMTYVEETRKNSTESMPESAYRNESK